MITIFWLANQEDGPKYDFGRGDYDLARAKLTKIGQINGVIKPGSSKTFNKLFQKEVELQKLIASNDDPISILTNKTSGTKP